MSKINIEKLAKKEWYVEHFDGCPAFVEMTGAGFTSYSYGKNFPPYDINFCYYQDEQGNWLSLISRQQFIGQTIIKNYLKNKIEFKNNYQAWLKEFKIMFEFYYENFNLDLSQFNNEELKKWMKSLYNFYKNEVRMPGFIDGYMFYADKRFDVLVKDFCEKKKIKNYPIIYSMLSAAVEPSFINEEESDLNKVINKIRKLIGNSKDLEAAIRNNKTAMKMIKEHLKKYSWAKSSYLGFKEYKIKDIFREIEKNFNNKNNLNIFIKYKKAKEKLIRKYKFTPEIIAITELTEKLIKWQDQRKVYTLTFAGLQSKILKEISRRTKVKYDLLKYSTIDDLYLILDKKFKINELLKRRKSSLFVYQGGKSKIIFSDKLAKDFFKKISEIKLDKAKEIRGMTASVGRAKGIVRIIISVKQIKKVKEGDILVAPMTRPEHLAGMKKAVAIVTDEGGITCHAAIVSRELGIPCVIGTKIATKVLHDGDLVEVDADKGVVKILKR